MTSNAKKLEALKEWLAINQIPFIANYKSGFGVTIDVKIPHLMIAVFLSEGDTEHEMAVYNAKGSGGCKLHHVYKPLFIRKNETKEFVLEKIQNCCYDRLVALQRKFERDSST